MSEKEERKRNYMHYSPHILVLLFYISNSSTVPRILDSSASVWALDEATSPQRNRGPPLKVSHD